MFPFFKNFLIIYVFILCTCAPLFAKNTTPIDEKKVKEEIAPILEKYKNVLNAVEKDDRLKKEGIFEGALESLGRKAVKADAKADALLEERGKLGTQKDRADMFQLLLAITFRVDQLEETYAPNEDFKGMQRSKRWMKISAMETPAVEELKNKIRSAGMTELSFAKTVERLVNERNNRAEHAKIPLPSLVQEKTIEGALRIMEITEDHEAVETLKILVDPKKGGDLTVKTSENPGKGGSSTTRQRLRVKSDRVKSDRI